MDEGLKKKVMVGVFTALVGVLVWVNWPEGKPDYGPPADDWEPRARAKKEAEPEVRIIEREKRQAEEEELVPDRRRKPVQAEGPIRKNSKKPTAKKKIVPAV